MRKQVKTYQVKIYLSGNLDIIKQTCREYCMVGLCVTIQAVTFVYTGGEEFGVEIGLINYPRFPDTKENILNKAIELAALCRDKAFQHSFLVMDNEDTFYHSSRKN